MADELHPRHTCDRGCRAVVRLAIAALLSLGASRGVIAQGSGSTPLYELPSGVETRWASPENPTGREGPGRRARTAVARARRRSRSRPDRAWCSPRRASTSGTVRRIWMTIFDAEHREGGAPLLRRAAAAQRADRHVLGRRAHARRERAGRRFLRTRTRAHGAVRVCALLQPRRPQSGERRADAVPSRHADRAHERGRRRSAVDLLRRRLHRSATGTRRPPATSTRTGIASGRRSHGATTRSCRASRDMDATSAPTSA